MEGTAQCAEEKRGCESGERERGVKASTSETGRREVHPSKSIKRWFLSSKETPMLSQK